MLKSQKQHTTQAPLTLNDFACQGFCKKITAFTLAEVLITLAIIGVVAALTIPTVVQNYQKTQTATRLKKAYATINQAIQMANVDNGPISTWNLNIACGGTVVQNFTSMSVHI